MFKVDYMKPHTLRMLGDYRTRFGRPSPLAVTPEDAAYYRGRYDAGPDGVVR